MQKTTEVLFPHRPYGLQGETGCESEAPSLGWERHRPGASPLEQAACWTFTSGSFPKAKPPAVAVKFTCKVHLDSDQVSPPPLSPLSQAPVLLCLDHCTGLLAGLVLSFASTACSPRGGQRKPVKTQDLSCHPPAQTASLSSSVKPSLTTLWQKTHHKPSTGFFRFSLNSPSPPNIP